MEEGEYLYFDAQYASGGGGDNFALAVVQHNSSGNRKDTPAAIDEKQLIDVSMQQGSYEVHRLTLKGANLGGSFRLSLGGKVSRAIAADATAAQVGAAVREMLSNCDKATQRSEQRLCTMCSNLVDWYCRQCFSCGVALARATTWSTNIIEVEVHLLTPFSTDLGTKTR